MALTKIGTTGILNNLDVPGYLYLSGDNKELRFYNGANYMILKASGSLSNNYTITLPVDDGTTGQFLKTNGSGVTSWDTVTSSDTTYTTAWVDSSTNAILRLTAGGSGSGNDDLTILAGTNITLTPSGDNLTIDAAGGGGATVEAIFFTRTAAAASGAVTYGGAGGTPSGAIVVTRSATTGSSFTVGVTEGDLTDHICGYYAFDSTPVGLSNSSQVSLAHNAAGDNQQYGQMSAWTSTGGTITWVKVGSGEAVSGYIIWLR